MKTKNDEFAVLDMGPHFVSRKQPHLMQIVQALELELVDYKSDGLVIGQETKKYKFMGLDLLEFMSTVSRLEFNNFLAKVSKTSKC